MRPKTLLVAGRIMIALGMLCWIVAICAVVYAFQNIFDAASTGTVLVVAPLLGIVLLVVGSYLASMGRG